MDNNESFSYKNEQLINNNLKIKELFITLMKKGLNIHNTYQDFNYLYYSINNDLEDLIKILISYGVSISNKSIE